MDHLQIDQLLVWSLGALGAIAIIRTVFAVQKGDALDAFCLDATLRQARRFVPINLVSVGLRSAIISTTTAPTARAF
jgi:hypothetical protein